MRAEAFEGDANGILDGEGGLEVVRGKAIAFARGLWGLGEGA
jgi:hypothetical protein